MKNIITAAAGSAALTAVLIYGSTISGCASKAMTPADPRPHIDHASEATKTIPPLMDSNKAETASLLKKLPETLQLRVTPHTSLIDQNSEQAKQAATTAAADLKKATEQAEASNAAASKLQAENDKLEDDLKDARQNNMGGVILLSILTFVAGVGLAVYGNTKLGVALAAAGVAGAVLAVTLAHSAVLIGIGCGAILLAAIGFMVWNLVVERKATSELVATGEAVKAYLSPQQRAAVYGVGGAPGVADVLQSDSTQALVEQHRGVTGPGTVRLTPNVAIDQMVVPATPEAA